MSDERIVVALDVATRREVTELCRALSGGVKMVKVGLRLFVAEGPSIVEYVRSQGFDVFLDLKLHDIPHQVGLTCAEIVKMGVAMFTIHAAGGPGMMQDAVTVTGTVSEELGVPRPAIVAVTLLTSLDKESLASMGVERDVLDQVVNLAELALEERVDGVVASPQEVEALRSRLGQDFIIVTPGIRPSMLVDDDQKRTATPAGALASGADYLVIGRPITSAPDPAAALEAILSETP